MEFRAQNLTNKTFTEEVCVCVDAIWITTTNKMEFTVYIFDAA